MVGSDLVIAPARLTDERTVLPLASRPGGHRLGVNGLSIDHDRNILYVTLCP